MKCPHCHSIRIVLMNDDADSYRIRLACCACNFSWWKSEALEMVSLQQLKQEYIEPSLSQQQDGVSCPNQD